MRLLALDLATKLGWAYGDTIEGDPVSGAHKLPSTGEDIGPFAVAYDQWLNGMLDEASPKTVVFEAPMPTTGGKTPIFTMLKLQGLCFHTEFVCWQRGINVRQIPAATWKKAFTGSGSASKAKARASGGVYPVIAACEQRGWSVRDDNEADALGIFCVASQMLGGAKAARFEPLFRSVA